MTSAAAQQIGLRDQYLEQVKVKFFTLAGGRIIFKQDQVTGIATIMLDHSEKKNSISGKMMVELSEVLTKVENWTEGKGLILYSEGDVFCSGLFLDTVRQLPAPEDGLALCGLMQNIMMRIKNLRLITLTIIQGKAIGAGAELILSTDFRLMTQNAEVAFVHSKMGLTTVCGGTKLLKDLIGHQKALSYLLTGRKIIAQESLRIGLADLIVQSSETRLIEGTLWLMTRIEELTPQLVQFNKNSLLGNCLQNERKLFVSLWGSDGHKEKLRQNIKH